MAADGEPELGDAAELVEGVPVVEAAGADVTTVDVCHAFVSRWLLMTRSHKAIRRVGLTSTGRARNNCVAIVGELPSVTVKPASALCAEHEPTRFDIGEIDGDGLGAVERRDIGAALVFFEDFLLVWPAAPHGKGRICVVGHPLDIHNVAIGVHLA